MIQLKQLVEPVIERKDHVWGSIQSSIIILEYGSYGCMDSRDFFWVIKKLQKSLKSEISYVFRNFLLENSHPRALNAAIAVEAAGAQNKFFEMHDLLFSQQESLEEEYFLECANKIGLDMELFNRDYFNRVYWGRIKNDIDSGIMSGVEKTPTIFINGIMYEESYDYKTIFKVIKSVMSVR